MIGGDGAIAARRTGAILGDHVCVVYLIAASVEGPTKIGVTRNLQTRLATLQIGSWSPLTIHSWRAAIPTGPGAKYQSMSAAMKAGARLLESEAHSTIREFGLGLCGEWFDIGITDAKAVLDKVGEKRGVRAVTLEQIAGAPTDRGLDVRAFMAQRSLVGSLATIAEYVRLHQPYPIDVSADL